MNSGCYENDISKVLVSIQAIDKKKLSVIEIKKEDIKFLRGLSKKEYINKENTLILMESGDEVLPYKETSEYFKGCYIDIVFGGNHSYESMQTKLKKISDFLNIE